MATLGSDPTLYVGGKIQQRPVLLKVNPIQVVKPQFHPIIKGIIGRLKIRLIEDQEKKIKLYSIAWSFIPRGNDTHFTVVLLVRFGALAEIRAYQPPLMVAIDNRSQSLVIPVVTINTMIQRVFIDHGISADILFRRCFNAPGLTEKDLKAHPDDLFRCLGKRLTQIVSSICGSHQEPSKYKENES
ncbi:hypothetical protein PIB30_077806 [Stylosanthes scabra]|uniref:Uncharacterized protein n=1 Tax=Stylosanthes scabra TaxID=79078 RepID=A0ABU6YPP4_9FABA|nr:hypothetical protein [Stylosanthes scabra]